MQIYMLHLNFPEKGYALLNLSGIQNASRKKCVLYTAFLKKKTRLGDLEKYAFIYYSLQMHYLLPSLFLKMHLGSIKCICYA